MTQRDDALAALNAVIDPASGKGLVDAGLVQALTLREDRAGFVLEAPAGRTAEYGAVQKAAEAALLALPGVERAQVVLTAPTATPHAPRAKVAADPRADTQGMPPAERLAGVKRVIAVASGKGGVGKSTVSVNLACALAAKGLKVGLLDADIYGPSAPRMLGLSQKPAFVDGKLEPLIAHGVRVMSIGFIVEEGKAMIWRGPMASSALSQMIKDVRWGELDVLIVDLPPGTGDVHLTLVQKLRVDGAIIVSTPQEIALIDARRAIGMFEKMNPPVPVIGLIENMAYFPDPATGAPIEIFGRGGAKDEAAVRGLPFLGEVPIDIAARQGGDSGTPVVLSGGVAAEAFKAIAEAI
jgi:ATP-binding protein involved in chromosome partitioning